MSIRVVCCTLLNVALAATAARAETISTIWLTHPVSDASQLMVNWVTEEPAPSQVEYGPSPELGERKTSDSPTTLHQVPIPFPSTGMLHYRVSSGAHQSKVHAVRAYGDDVLRVAFAANWQGHPSLDALRVEKPHLLIGCGDYVPHLISMREPAEPDNIAPFTYLIEKHPELFATTPFMPALGNHDRQIRPRFFEPLMDPTYDIEATAFRKFFPLPDDGWKWYLDIPGFDLRFIALDFSHIGDIGDNWQSCHPIHLRSAQYQWYLDLMPKSKQRFVVTVYNEQHRLIRRQNNGAWGKLIQLGSMAVTGFGHFAERSEVNGFPHFNTALKAGQVYPDMGHTAFVKSAANYVLMTVPRDGGDATVRLKGLDGATLDESTWPARTVE